MTPAQEEEQVGRGMVLIPELDFGLIAQTREGMVTAAGNPRSDAAESFAISLALDVAQRFGLLDFRVCSDCEGAVVKAADPRVEWHSRKEMGLPNGFFDKVLGRASYLRRTEGKVKRRAVQDHQLEIFELFTSVRREFKLSESEMWARVRRDALKSGEPVLGLCAALAFGADGPAY